MMSYKNITNTYLLKKLYGYKGIILFSVLTIVLFTILLPEQYRQFEGNDFYLFYDPVAQHIFNGEGITLNGELAFRYPPGMPVLLSGIYYLSYLTGISYYILWRLSIWSFFVLSACVLLAISKLFWRPVLAFIPPVLWSIYPFSLWLYKQPNSAVYFIPIFWFSIYSYIKFLRSKYYLNRWLYITGILCSFAMLIRPIALFLPLVFIIHFLYISNESFIKKIAVSTLLILSASLIVAPWIYHIYNKTDKIVLLSNGGLPSIKDGLTFAVNPEKQAERKPISFSNDVNAMMMRIYRKTEKVNHYSSLASILFDEFTKYPLTFSKLILIKVQRSWYATDSRRFEFITAIIQIVFLLLAVWGAREMYVRSHNMSEIILLLLLTLYFWVMTITVLSILRYMVPIAGLLFLYYPGIIMRYKNKCTYYNACDS